MLLLIMRDPVRSLKQLPWNQLFQVALATTAVIGILDFAIAIAALQNQNLRSVIIILLSPPLSDLITAFFSGMGVGAVASYILEKWFTKVPIYIGNLWALILCLLVTFGVKSLFPLPSVLNGMDRGILVIGIIFGVFLTKRRYWR